jgi:hypothetical protein
LYTFANVLELSLESSQVRASIKRYKEVEEKFAEQYAKYKEAHPDMATPEEGDTTESGHTVSKSTREFRNVITKLVKDAQTRKTSKSSAAKIREWFSKFSPLIKFSLDVMKFVSSVTSTVCLNLIFT